MPETKAPGGANAEGGEGSTTLAEPDPSKPAQPDPQQIPLAPCSPLVVPSAIEMQREGDRMLARHRAKHPLPTIKPVTFTLPEIGAAPPAGADLLTQVIERVRPMLATGSTKQRVRLLWATARAARDLASSDQVHAEFMQLAIDAGLIDSNGRWTGADVAAHVPRHGAEDVRHVLRWAALGRNPFEEGR